MRNCTIYHTGVFISAEGIIKDNIVYIEGKDGSLCFPEEIFMAREESERGLIQFEVDKKWGFADIYTGEIIIELDWDYAGPFYRGYAHVVKGADLDIQGKGGMYNILLEGGKHGYIGLDGEISIPLEYDYAEDIPYHEYFMVTKDKKKGLIDRDNSEIIPLKWDYLETGCDHDLIFCGVEERCEPCVGPTDKVMASTSHTEPRATCDYITKWGIYNQNFELIIPPELDERPAPYKRNGKKAIGHGNNSKYYLLKSKRKYAVFCNDGRLISNIELTKNQAIALIKSIS